MEWGTFSMAHIVSLVAAVCMIVILYFSLRRATKAVQTLVLGILSFAGIAAILYNLLRWDEPLAYLPLHLCSFNAMILPFAVFSRNKTLGNLLLVWSLGALIALVLNWDMAHTELFSGPFIFYYFPHVLEFGIPILLFKLDLVKKDPKCIGSTLLISMGAYTIAHTANVLVNTYSDIKVNYMFSVDPTQNALVGLFYQILPLKFWYMLLVLPIVAVYLCVIYLPQFAQSVKRRKAAI